jgi:hypothetical protein
LVNRAGADRRKGALADARATALIRAMYKPNFCAECGTKLLRLRWHLWTSRKFCHACARRLRKVRLVPTLFAVLALISAGYVAGRIRRPTPPPLVIERRSDSPLVDGEPGGATPQSVTTQSGVESGADSTASPSSSPAQDQSTLADEAVYICGARTKKGTPCSRRVHGPVRCWQHKGLPSIIPVVSIK